MRLLFGIVLGAALTIGAAYLHDTLFAGAASTFPPASDQRPIVNWDVAGARASQLTRSAREQVERLAGK